MSARFIALTVRFPRISFFLPSILGGTVLGILLPFLGIVK